MPASTTIFLDFGGTCSTPEQERNNISKTVVVFENSFVVDRFGNYAYDCCKNCPNNPMNNPFASGFCNCVLPAMHQIRY